MRKHFMVLMMMVLAGSFMGCKKSLEEKPVDEVKEEAQQMSAEELQEKVNEYQAAIEAKKPEIEKLQKELGKGLSGMLSGDKPENAEELEAELTELQASVKALEERMAIYANELKKKQAS